MTQADLFGAIYNYKDLKKIKELFKFKLKRMKEYDIIENDILKFEVDSKTNEIMFLHREYGIMYFVSSIDEDKQNYKYIDIPNFIDMFFYLLRNYFKSNDLTIERKIA